MQENAKFNYQGVIQTNDEATLCKWCCVSKGYFEDPFVQHFLKQPTMKKNPPLINRGYFARVFMIRTIIQQFLNSIPSDVSNEGLQLVLLGAGNDTLYFLLKSKLLQVSSAFQVFELDLPEVVSKKIQSIQASHILQKTIGEFSCTTNNTELHGNDYHVISCDLSDVSAVQNVLQRANISFSKPTLFLSECVLVYLHHQNSDTLLQWIASSFEMCSICVYEQINPNDPFGKTMIQNLQKRGCPLLSLEKYPTLADQKQRYLQFGWQRVEGHDLYHIYNNVIPKEHTKRIEKLEFLDELEEWKMIQEHYSIVWAFHSHSPDTLQMWENMGFQNTNKVSQ